MSATSVRISDEELVALWLVDPGDMLLSFGPDGSYASDTHGVLGRNPDVVGSYELTGGELSFEQSADSIDCPAGSTANWRFTDFVDGTFTAEWIDNSCYPQAAGDRWTFIRVSPDGRLEPPLPSDLPPMSLDVSPGSTRGAWLFAGTSIVLELHDDGTYVMDDEGRLAYGPMETGTFDAESGRVELTVTRSSVCQAGDRRVLGDARVYSTHPTFRFIPAVTDDECGRLPGTVTLVIISS